MPPISQARAFEGKKGIPAVSQDEQQIKPVSH
jgi:hypothetical protein